MLATSSKARMTRSEGNSATQKCIDDVVCDLIEFAYVRRIVRRVTHVCAIPSQNEFRKNFNKMIRECPPSHTSEPSVARIRMRLPGPVSLEAVAKFRPRRRNRRAHVGAHQDSLSDPND